MTSFAIIFLTLAIGFIIYNLFLTGLMLKHDAEDHD